MISKSRMDQLHEIILEDTAKRGKFKSELYLYDYLYGLCFAIRGQTICLYDFWSLYYGQDIKDQYESGLSKDNIIENMKSVYTLTPKHMNLKKMNVGAVYGTTELHVFEIFVDEVLRILSGKNPSEDKGER